MKQQINEVRRMQQLAGIKPINEDDFNQNPVDDSMDESTLEEGPLATQLLKKVEAALKNGQNVTVQGKPIKKVVIMAGAFFPTDDSKSIRIYNLENPLEDVLIDGQPVEIDLPEPKPAPVDNRTQAQKDADAKAWNDRYGPNGGYMTAFGRYTGD